MSDGAPRRPEVQATPHVSGGAKPISIRNWWLVAAALAAAVAVALPLFVFMSRRHSSRVAPLIAAAPRDHRRVEARLSGFPWARLEAPMRGEAARQPSDLQLSGAAGDVLGASADLRDPDAQRATGVAHLLIDERTEAIRALDRAAHASADARVWNDLAAARYAAAVTDDRASELPQALADVKHALRLDPALAEGLFNIALIVERMGITDQARKAWQRYIASDRTTGWSSEARTHLGALPAASPQFDEKLLDTAPPVQLVRSFPQETRTWSEGVLLARWADADGDSAPAVLARAHSLGDALAAFHGERLLADAVRAIEQSAGASRTALVAAHRIYRGARIEYSRHNAGVAERQFRGAAELFRAGGSPMQHVAAYYAASAAFDQHRGAEAREELHRIAGAIDRGRYRALTAQLQWQLAVAENTDGDWGAAARDADAAAAGFRILGERSNAAFVDAVGAVACEMMGERDLAWSRRIAGCTQLSAAGERARRNALLYGAAVTLAPIDRPDAAAAVIDLMIDDARHNPAELAGILAMRASDTARAGDIEVARASIAEARSAVARVRDAALRQTVAAQVSLAAAEVDVSTSPESAIAALDHSIRLFASGRLSILLPEAYLQRGRAHRSGGDANAALADYEAALTETEKQQATIAGGDARFNFFDTAARIVDELIDFHLSRGAVRDAFAVADRSRGLFEMPSASAHAPAPPPLPKGVAVIEYAILPHSIVLFCLSSEGISAKTLPVERRDLAADVDSLAEKIRRRAPLDDLRRDSAELYRILIAPAKPHLGGVEEVVFVPDRQLHAVPFAALWDEHERKYLVEQYAIRFAPAGKDAGTAANEDTTSPVLVVADPSAPHSPRLLASRGEGSRIARLYGAGLVTGDSATKTAFVHAAETSRLVHFAGHANSDAGESYAALLFAPGSADDGVLAAGEIAQLRLARHPLVVLAGCGTFRGSAAHVAGMSSLARSFLSAGARGVVGTLWEIDDDVSAPLFTRIHELLFAGAWPANALRTAQLEMLRASDPRISSPASWSPVEYLSNR
jgi:CHAT domain-containing protein